MLVELVFLDIADGGGPAVSDLFLLVQEGRGRQHDAAGVARRAFQRLRQAEGGALVFLGDEAAVHVAAADAQLQHHRRLAGLGQRKAVFHRLDHAFQIGARVQQPDLRFHGERVRAFLHDGRAFAVVLAHDHQRAAGDAAGCQVGQRVRGDVGADRGFPGDGATDRIHDRGRQRGGGGGFRGAGLEVHAEFLQDLVGVGQHVHQVRDGRTLVAGHIAHAGLQQGLGDREDALAAELFARADAQLLDFFEGPFSHLEPLVADRCAGPCALLLRNIEWSRIHVLKNTLEVNFLAVNKKMKFHGIKNITLKQGCIYWLSFRC